MRRAVLKSMDHSNILLPVLYFPLSYFLPRATCWPSVNLMCLAINKRYFSEGHGLKVNRQFSGSEIGNEVHKAVLAPHNMELSVSA